MKKLIICSLLIFVICLSATGCGNNFKDKDFEKAITEMLEEGNLKKDDYKSIESFVLLDHQEVKSIEDIKFLSELESLAMTTDSVQDLSPLTHIKDTLTELHIFGETEVDLGFLKDLDNLQALAISSESWKDFNQLSDLNNVDTLWIVEGNGIDEEGSFEFADDIKDIDHDNMYVYFNENFASVETIEKLKGVRVIACNSGNLEDINIDDYSEVLTKLMSEGKLEEVHIGDVVILDNEQLNSDYFPKDDDIKEVESTEAETIGNEAEVSEEYIKWTNKDIGMDLSIFLDKDINMITEEEAATASSYDLSKFDNTSDLTDLKYLTGIKELKIEMYDDLSEFGFLENMPWLEKLSIENEDFQDISQLSKLVNLKELRLNGTAIEDISELASLEQLEVLMLNDTNVLDISIISNFKKLKELELKSTNVLNISPLSELVTLEKLNLRGTALTDIRPLIKLINMKVLQLEFTNVEFLKGIEEMTNLTYLDLESTEVADLSELTNLTNLVYLSLELNSMSDIKIEDFSPLHGLVKLEKLILSNRNINNVDFLSNMINLEILDVSGTNVESLEVIGNLLNFKDITIRNMEHLKNKKGLEYVGTVRE